MRATFGGPASQGELGDLEESGMGLAETVSAINRYLRADRDLAEALRPECIDYILEHQ
jgi:hypothetical protein